MEFLWPVGSSGPMLECGSGWVLGPCSLLKGTPQMHGIERSHHASLLKVSYTLGGRGTLHNTQNVPTKHNPSLLSGLPFNSKVPSIKAALSFLWCPSLSLFAFCGSGGTPYVKGCYALSLIYISPLCVFWILPFLVLYSKLKNIIPSPCYFF